MKRIKLVFQVGLVLHNTSFPIMEILGVSVNTCRNGVYMINKLVTMIRCHYFSLSLFLRFIHASHRMMGQYTYPKSLHRAFAAVHNNHPRYLETILSCSAEDGSHYPRTSWCFLDNDSISVDEYDMCLTSEGVSKVKSVQGIPFFAKPTTYGRKHRPRMVQTHVSLSKQTLPLSPPTKQKILDGRKSTIRLVL